MATIKSPNLFFITSPRTPFKMQAEIGLLVKEFAGQKWKANPTLQCEFMHRLAALPEFEGSFSQNDPALSARDRITRGPKSLGLVNLDKIALTPAGAQFLDEDLAAEALLRQLLKFQLPSPFHKENPKIAKKFCIKPYLEIVRLIYTLGRLAFDELCLFGLQLTDWHEFDRIVKDVQQFRIAKGAYKGKYKRFLQLESKRIVAGLYTEEIGSGKIRTRESRKISLDNFIKTKLRNMRDYADACTRYLRATGLVTVTSPGKTLSLIEQRRDDIEFVLKNVDREPVFVDNETEYCHYLFSGETPRLLTDDRVTIESRAVKCFAVGSVDLAASLPTPELKKRIQNAMKSQREALIDAQITELKAFGKYDDVLRVYDEITRKDAYDPPLALEWNAWRTMTMMDGGRIHANLKFDDAGNPLATAPGKNADIICDYGDFFVSVEVTLLCGEKQYDAEGEPVARHLGGLKKSTGKEAYCLFVAPKINASTISHFYALHQTKIKHYGGKSVIIPLTIKQFVNMLTQARDCGYVPSPDRLRAFCEFSRRAADEAEDEEEWYAAVSQKANKWLV